VGDGAISISRAIAAGDLFSGRVGVTRTTIQVRELDPATNRYAEVASFNPAEDAVPAVYSDVKDDVDTRYRALVAEGVTGSCEYR